MKITLLNANHSPENYITENFVNDLQTQLTNDGHECSTFVLRKMELAFCIGCWTCWWKTPGECGIKDDIVKILPELVKSDLLLFVSPLIMGFPTSLLKKTQDRLIPNLLPYIELVDGECHHAKRYENYPKIGLIVQPEIDTDEKDLQIIKKIYQRFSLNFKSKLAIFSIIKDVKEISNEINSI